MNPLQMQGDVALRKINPKDTKDAQTVQDKVLAWGEHSGHAHTVTGDAEVFEIDGKMIVVTGNDGAKLEHIMFKTKAKADHAPLTLEPNTTYEVILQNEYNPLAGALERVVD